MAPFSDMQALLRAEWDVQGPAQIDVINIMCGILEGLTACPQILHLPDS